MKSRSIIIFIALFVLMNNVKYIAQAPDKKEKILKNNIALIDKKIQQLAKEWSIPAMSVAIIQEGKLAWHNAFGIKNSKTYETVDENTIFDAASLTKPLFAYFTMMMIDKGIIKLDTPLVKYLPKEKIDISIGAQINNIAFRYDWFSKITTRHVLSHSSGMAHGEAHTGGVYPLFFEPGTKFRYSAEGYYLLQKVLEEKMGCRLDTLINKYIFRPMGMNNSYMVWNEKINQNAAFGHNIINEPTVSLRKALAPHSAASLYTTANDYAKFIIAVLNGQYLSKESYKTMFTPVIKRESNIFWSLGFGIEESSIGNCIWQWGDWGTFRNFVMADIKTKKAVIYFTNSYYGLSIYDKIIEMVFEGDHPLTRSNSLKPYRSFDLNRRLIKDIDGTINYLHCAAFKDSKEYSDAEGNVDAIAHGYLQSGKLDEAIKLFKYNIATFPESWNAWDSMGEAYTSAGMDELAIEAYEKAIKLNPRNENGKTSIIRLNIFKRVQKDIDEALKYFSTPEFKGSKEFSTIEIAINILAYKYLQSNKLTEAIKLFKYNIETFPDSGNAWDSIGEAYMKAGLDVLAIEAYEKSLKIYPSSQSGIKALKKLKEKK